MAHFAQIDGNNIVINVVVVADSDCQDGNGDESEAVGIAFMKSILGSDTNWVQTSYNNRIRKNYASVGYTWDSGRNAFIPPKPFASWVLDETTCRYKAPVDEPNDADASKGITYSWDESNTEWVRD